MERYDHKKIERKWQDRWQDEKAFLTPTDPDPKNKKYILDMFPYPSGEGLHAGHVKGYTATDVYARFLRMKGFEVMHPMGWDAFGLPAENFAVKTGTPPQETTQSSIANFTRQIKAMGLSYDWEREINTSSPEYYRWTQWLFLTLYKQGLAYKKEAPVNWCPGCQTVLANEQVVNGECERCGTSVTEKNLAQWFFRITDYAEDLIEDLALVDWPESTKLAQLNWIGKSEGVNVSFPLTDKFHYVILHGFASGPDLHFLPSLRKELEDLGHTVEIPELPNAKDPDVNEQVNYVKENVRLDKNTILVGHSLGAVVAMKVLEGSPEKIQKLTLVGGFSNPGDTVKREYVDRFDWRFDFEKIKDNTHFIEVLHDKDDDVVTKEQAKDLGDKLGVGVTEVKAEEAHFRASEEKEAFRASLMNIKAFTTRADTLFGATYMVLAPEHPLVQSLSHKISNWNEVESYIEQAREKTKIERTAEGREKTGVRLEGISAINPASKDEVPVFIADYVLYDYGTGAIMAVPAHDERDHEFAQKFDLEIKEVVSGEGDIPRAEYGTLVNSGKFDGLEGEEAKKAIVQFVEGENKTSYKLRDWLVSRQRYWGAPIPIVYDPEGNPHPVPEEHLPWSLPTDVDYRPQGTAPLGTSQELLERTEKIFGEGWTPEIDTMDTFVDSSWYYFRFTDPHNAESFADKNKIAEWLPVDVYVGGAEHTVLHLLYARFITKVFNTLGLVDIKEPFLNLRHPGMVLASDGNKMSKSKGNVVSPDEVLEVFGADTMRAYEMFMGPFDQAVSWSTDNMVGVRRFIEKIWRLQEKVQKEAEEDRALTAEAIKKVTSDVERFHFNTAISALMIFVNELDKKTAVALKDFEILIKLAAPFAPHVTAELYEIFGFEGSLHSAVWPEYDEKDLERDEVTLVVQVNGKVRDSISIESGVSEEDVRAKALTEKVKKWTAGKEIKRVIIVPKKLVNFVVAE